jgi:hypothetical protein
MDMDMHRGNEIQQVDMDMQHGQGNAHGQGYVPLTRTYSMDMDVQEGHGYAAWKWTCTMAMGIQVRHRQAALTWKCSIDKVLGMQHGNTDMLAE